MATRTKPKRKKKARAPSSTRWGRIEILLEEMQAQNAATIEAVYAESAAIRREMRASFRTLDERIALLELTVKGHTAAIRDLSEAVRKNSEDIRKNSEDIRKNSEDIQRNSEDIRKISDDLLRVSGTVEDLGARVAHLEARVERLEAWLKESLERIEVRLGDIEHPLSAHDLDALERRVTVLEERVGIVPKTT